MKVEHYTFNLLKLLAFFPVLYFKRDTSLIKIRPEITIFLWTKSAENSRKLFLFIKHFLWAATKGFTCFSLPLLSFRCYCLLQKQQILIVPNYFKLFYATPPGKSQPYPILDSVCYPVAEHPECLLEMECFATLDALTKINCVITSKNITHCVIMEMFCKNIEFQLLNKSKKNWDSNGFVGLQNIIEQNEASIKLILFFWIYRVNRNLTIIFCLSSKECGISVHTCLVADWNSSISGLFQGRGGGHGAPR